MRTMKPSHLLCRHTRAVLLDVDLPFMKLRAEKALPLGEHSVELRIGFKTFPISVTLVRECEGGHQWVRLLDGGPAGEVLEHRFLQDRLQTQAEDRRDDSRYKVSLSVHSPDLPQHRATTYDISEYGLRLVTERPVPVGKVLRLEVLQSQRDEQGPAVKVRGEAVWCVPCNWAHHVGVRLA